MLSRSLFSKAPELWATERRETCTVSIKYPAKERKTSLKGCLLRLPFWIFILRSTSPETKWQKPINNMKVKVLVAQSCQTFCDPMDCGLPVSSAHGILQARILKCVAMPFQGIFPTQGSNSGLLHCRQILYHLSHQGSQIYC